MTAKEQKTNILFALLGALFLSCPKLISSGALDGISTIAAFAVFLSSVCLAKNKKELFVLYLAFAAGYTCRFFGTFGYAAADTAIGILLGSVVFLLLLVQRKTAEKCSRVYAALVFPALWMVLCLVFVLIRFPAFMRLDWLFQNMKLLMQCISLVTVYGFAFLVLLVSGLIAYSVCQRKPVGAVLALALLAAMAGYGAVRLGSTPEAENTVRVAYATGPYVGDFRSTQRISSAAALESFDCSLETAADAGAAVLAFNEETFEIEDTDEAYFLEPMAEKAGERNIHVLVGFDIEKTGADGETGCVNKVVWIGANGQIMDEYIKKKPIPLVEGEYESGNGQIPVLTLQVNGQPVRVAFAICYDGNFPCYISQIGPSTDLLFLPSWDWPGVARNHYRICSGLAIQCGVTVVKSTYDGYSAVIDEYGRTIAVSNTNETGYEAVRVVDVPVTAR